MKRGAFALQARTGLVPAQRPKELAPSVALENIQLLVRRLAGPAPAVANASPETTGRVQAQQPKARARRVLTDHTLLYQTKALAQNEVAATLGCIGKTAIRKPKVNAKLARQDTIPTQTTSWHAHLGLAATQVLTGRAKVLKSKALAEHVMVGNIR